MALVVSKTVRSRLREFQRSDSGLATVYRRLEKLIDEEETNCLRIVQAFQVLGSSFYGIELLSHFFRREYRSTYPRELVTLLQPIAAEGYHSMFESMLRVYRALCVATDKGSPETLMEPISLLCDLDGPDLEITRAHLASGEGDSSYLATIVAACAYQVDDDLRLSCFRLAPKKRCFIIRMLFPGVTGERAEGDLVYIRQIRVLCRDREFRESFHGLIRSFYLEDNDVVRIADTEEIISWCIDRNTFVRFENSLELPLLLRNFPEIDDASWNLFPTCGEAYRLAIALWNREELREPIRQYFGRGDNVAVTAVLDEFPRHPEACEALMQVLPVSKLETEFLRRARSRSVGTAQQFVLAHMLGPTCFQGYYEHQANCVLRRAEGELLKCREQVRALVAFQKEDTCLQPLIDLAVADLSHDSRRLFALSLLLELSEEVWKKPRPFGDSKAGIVLLALRGEVSQLLHVPEAELRKALGDWSLFKEEKIWLRLFEELLATASFLSVIAEIFEAVLVSHGESIKVLDFDEFPKLRQLLSEFRSDQAVSIQWHVLTCFKKSKNELIAGLLQNVEALVRYLGTNADKVALHPSQVDVVRQIPAASKQRIVALLGGVQNLGANARALWLSCITSADLSKVFDELAREMETDWGLRCSLYLLRNAKSEDVQQNLASITTAIQLGNERIVENLIKLIASVKVRSEEIQSAIESRLQRTPKGALRKQMEGLLRAR